eukprot:4489485-Prymnesium_polylepis.1
MTGPAALTLAVHAMVGGDQLVVHDDRAPAAAASLNKSCVLRRPYAQDAWHGSWLQAPSGGAAPAAFRLRPPDYDDVAIFKSITRGDHGFTGNSSQPASRKHYAQESPKAPFVVRPDATRSAGERVLPQKRECCDALGLLSAE